MGKNQFRIFDRRMAKYCTEGWQNIRQEDGRILNRMAEYWTGGWQNVGRRTNIDKRKAEY